MAVQMAEHDLAEQTEEEELCDTMVAEIEADLAEDEPAKDSEHTRCDLVDF